MGKKILQTKGGKVRIIEAKSEKKKKEQSNRCQKEKEGRITMFKCNQIRDVPGEKKQKVSMKKK